MTLVISCEFCLIFKNSFSIEHLEWLLLRLLKNEMISQNSTSSTSNHCVKSVQIRSYFWPVFSCIQSKYRKIGTRNKSVIGHFSLSVRPLPPVCTCLNGQLWELIFGWCSLKKVFLKISQSLHENTCVGVSF